jgi:hypothetical protein
MRILDLFAGLGGEQRRKFVESRGHEYVTLDFDARFGCSITADILTVDSSIGYFDFIWASPPCEAFSVASIGHHWGGGSCAYQPKTEHAVHSQKIVQHTLDLIKTINPRKGWLMENPRGVLRKLSVVAGVPLQTVSYCRYGDTRMKPTDLWGEVPNWIPRPMCHNGHPDHEAAPRGARTGTQGMKGAAERAVVPIKLWEDILDAIEQ